MPQGRLFMQQSASTKQCSTRSNVPPCFNLIVIIGETVCIIYGRKQARRGDLIENSTTNVSFVCFFFEMRVDCRWSVAHARAAAAHTAKGDMPAATAGECHVALHIQVLHHFGQASIICYFVVLLYYFSNMSLIHCCYRD